MSSLTQLEYLLAVDRNRHFGRAAQECHVSQPSLSTQIQKLEEELGLIIFDRSKKPILPTEAGKEVIKQAKVILREHRRLQDLTLFNEQGPRGDFHLAVIPTMAPYIIPLFIGAFSKNYPKVNLKINEHKTEDIIKLLIDDEIDAGILATPLHEERIIERHLFYEPFHAFVAENHPLAKRKIISESDLDSESLWLLEEGHCLRSQVISLCSMVKKSNVLKNVEFESGNLETLVNLIKVNGGHTLLPRLATLYLSEEEKTKHLKQLKKPVPTREVSIVYSRSFLKEEIINALEKEILEAIPSSIKSLKKNQVDVLEFDY